MAALLTACPSPGGGDPGQTGKPVTPVKPITPPTYTTIVSGRVTTPAGNAVTQYDTATRRSVPSAEDAKVWASTDSAVKAAVAADGSFTLRVKHPGAFTLSVDYPAGRDYKAGSPQSVTTTQAAHTQDIALKYGYTTTLSGRVNDNLPSGGSIIRNGVPVIVYVEGREATRTDSRTIGGNVGRYVIMFDHPGTFRVAASFGGRTGGYSIARHTGPTSPTAGTIDLR